MRRIALFVFLFAIAAGAQNTLTANEIMARVAANQDRAEVLRKSYIYQQHVHVISRQTNGKLMREQTDDYDVTPTPEGSKKELKSRTGKYWEKGKYVDIRMSSKPEEDANSLDAEITSSFVDDLVNGKSKDGLAGHLFPLTTAEQKRYQFQLLGETEQDHRAVYRIGFMPRDNNEITWAGEALIDKDEFQPVLVFTKLSRKLPLLVRGALGTNVPGAGFNVHYRRQDDGVWFPVSFGTEFHLKVLFVMKRNIVLSMDNRNFRRTHVDTKITGISPTQ